MQAVVTEQVPSDWRIASPPERDRLHPRDERVGEPAPDAVTQSEWRRFYLSIPVKFCIALTAGIVWTAFSVWLSMPWLHDLARMLSWPLALFIVIFIAYVPGFMNAFLIVTILLDRRPRRSVPSRYPGVTVLIACYNEQEHIADTLLSISREEYPGDLEVLVLNDGSTDASAAVVERMLRELEPTTRARIRLIAYAKNSGWRVLPPKPPVWPAGLILARANDDCTHFCGWAERR